ncbi:MAG: carbon storage regulator [Chloroflexi bacterium]|nr:MAG: carbon storage regulator [Chloroflexota bacterium]RLT46627.1 MAG: carbon storage regulator [Chloroflexota bacterium]RLT53545.1 MAG: carbon storage regulator [Chloroflexota bacterium]
MLVLTRRVDEGLNIGGEISVRILAIDGDRVKLGVVAPRTVSILRDELCQQVRNENTAAAIPAAQRAAVARSLKSLVYPANEPDASQPPGALPAR